MIPLYKPYISADLSELKQIYHSGQLTYSKWGRQFEYDLRNFIEEDNLLSTNTYANALQLALLCLGLAPGDEVLASPMCCLQSTMPLVNFGLKIVWADIDPNTGTLNPNDVSKRITKKTKLIVHNHFCGYPGHIKEINTLARDNGLKVIDDCIEAFGSKYEGKYLGNVGSDVTIFNFQSVRLPNTIEGGAVIFKDSELFQEALIRRDFGIRRETFRDQYGEISPDCDISLQGIGGTLNEPNSYIGHQCMLSIKELLSIQLSNAEKWSSQYPEFKNLKRKEIEPNYWVYGILSSDKIKDILEFRDKGYYASGVHLPNNYYSVFGKKLEFAGVKEFYNKFMALPCGWWM